MKTSSKGAACTGAGGTIYADVLEDYMLGAIRERLSEFTALQGQEEKRISPKVNANKILISQIDNDINDLMSKVVGANATLMQYINEKIEALDTERKRLQEEILSLTCNYSENSLDVITNHVKQWDSIKFEDRQVVVNALIIVIHIADGNIEVTWNL